MQKRIVFGALALAIFVPFMWIGGEVAQVLVGGVAMLAVSELLRMRRISPTSVEGVLSLLGTLVLTLPLQNYLTFLPTDGNYAAFAVIALVILGATVWQFGDYTFDDAVYPIASSFYIGLGFHSLLLAQMDGRETLFFALILVWVTDSGAYLLGRQFGRRRLAPRVSPNKTVEGFLGGLLSAVIFAGIYLLLFPQVKSGYPYLLMLILVAIFSAFAQFGDLVESALKRHYGVKDSGRVIPGHGGILDRFDSLIFVLPIMHFFGLF
ncbi:phosphatidate cytidylyltransferase [Streptococcus ovuberis]|uniref:Phosphatidate cytidylyltransferase n=1 Tax=Streptococcus ovuberis TaxID=1936207 RepID=A0A7X6N0I9_9STRE|nr:phosphatidate cytidylyltransferase [Streptococcus ovuberis]NKZ20816.1 phosphatidate cytidylyltransferase [Streptococcus ovuberis]